MPAELLDENDTYRALFNNLLNGLAYCRIIYEGEQAVDFVYLRVNEAFTLQTGLRDVVGRRVSEVIPGLLESDASLFETYAQVAATGNPTRFERYVSALQMWFSIAAYSPERGYFVAIFDVITERKLADAALRESERRLARVIEGSDQGFWDWNLLTNSFTVSPRFETMLGYTAGELNVTPANWANLVHPDDLAAAKQSIALHLAGNLPQHERELRCRTRSGEWCWVLTRGRVVERDTEGRAVMMSGTHTDITERKRTELALRQAATVFENTQEGVIVTDARSVILSTNRAFSAMTGFEGEEAIGQTPAILRSGRHEPRFFAELWTHLDTGGHWQGEIWNRRKNGEIYPQLTTINAVRDDTGRVTHYVGVFTDISAIKASEERLEFLAYHDPLTRLPNRLTLFARLEHARHTVEREGGLMALLMIDLDRFKDVNDSYGHLMGDHLLQQVANRLWARLRGIDTLARLGGDEFTVLLEKISHPDDAGLVANDILDGLADVWRLPNGADVHIAASIGIALFPGTADTPEALLQQADAAMYRAKTEGRGRYHFFSEDLTRNARHRLELEGRLRRAIDGSELRVYFQPQIDIATGLCVGAEALVRWMVPGEGLIPPDKFIPLAEETGLILPLGRWVLRETCRIGRAWLDRGLPSLTLAINVAAAQLRHTGFAAEVLGIVAESGFPAAQVEIELTESSLMSDQERVIEQLRTLRQHHIRIAMDDFGTGYSSLAYLKRFPLDVLKIDRSFIEHVVQRRDDREIVTAIIQMGHTMGFKVVAEGVETLEQLAFLKDKGCNVYQGYLCSRPVPTAEFEQLLRHHR